MKQIILISLITSLIQIASAKEISLANGNITFEVPDHYTALSQMELDLKFPFKQAPRNAVGNSNRTVCIAYDIKTGGMPPQMLVDSELPNAKMHFTQVYSRIVPGIEWIQNEIIELSGEKWIFFELTSRGLDTDMHNMLLIGFHEQQMLMFNFNATKESFEKNMADLLKAKASIQIKQSSNQSTHSITGSAGSE